MILSNKLSITAAILAIFIPSASSHGYLKSPRSRNYYAHTHGVWYGGSASDPKPENCPHCLNIGGTEARCGLIEDRNYDIPKNSLGGSLDFVVQACYGVGAVVEFETMLTAYHMGHFEFYACPISSSGEVPTQACFDANPLTFISDENYGATPDPLYPERAYIPNNDYQGLIQDGNLYKFNHKYQLPPNLSGDMVLIQWHYVTGNSCKDVGYDTYDWPEGFYPGNIPVCSQPLPPDGRGVPEQFWNCAEVKISNTCDGADPPSSTSTTSSSTSTSDVTGATTTTSISTTSTTSVTTGATSKPENCAAETSACGPNSPCSNGMCCSQWGYCGTTDAYCGACCQNGGCWNGPTLPTSTTSSTSNTSGSSLPPYTADHGEDSRLIAYLGNWQSCPTDEQIDNYSHIVIAFAVSYTWSPTKNICDEECNIASTVPICNNANNQALVDKWRSMGKKVIVSFGGAGMGGSWSGDNNNCWDYCFGKEEQLSTSLVNIVDNQKLDGVDIDYEYCYDISGLQSGRCLQRTNNYTDAKAQNFLDLLTSKLRTKLDALQSSNGYNRGRYEVTHAPMDSDVARSDSKYYEILKNRRDDLDFLMPQFYNGVTRPASDGLTGHGVGAMAAVTLFDMIANDLFDHEPNKVIFGFCISDCSGTGSNVNANQAVQILSDLKTYNGGEFSCNGGAFFWVAFHDTNGSWSSDVLSEVSLTAGCSAISSSTSSTSTNTGATTSSSSTSTSATTQPPETSTSTTTSSTVLTTTTSTSGCVSPATSVKLESTTGEALNAFEIEVYDTSGINIATSGTASQSSVLKGNPKFGPESALDGNELSFIHTDTDDSSAWWQVDFSFSKPVELVSISNRWCRNVQDPNGCLCRMTSATLSLLDSEGAVLARRTLGDTCGLLTVSVDINSCQQYETPSASPVEVSGYPKAQIIKINSITGKPLNMFEFQVFSGGLNVAQGKAATQSSTLKSFSASLTVDGDYSSFSHTELEESSWFKLDLGEPFQIESMNIVNRYCKNTSDPSGCLCRLSHAVISLHDDKGEWITTVSIGDTCGVLNWSYDFSAHGSACTAWS